MRLEPNAPQVALSERTTLSNDTISGLATRTAPVDTFEGPASGDLMRQLSSPSSTLSIAIGNAEGTRTSSGAKTAAYFHHGDPANHVLNLGTFSFQAYRNKSVHTPEQADAVQLARLRSRVPAFEEACRRAGVDARNPLLQAAFFDLGNQCSPSIWNRFLTRMPTTLAGKELSSANLLKARFDALFDDRGRFTATGLKSPSHAMHDQTRRMTALGAVLAKRLGH